MGFGSSRKFSPPPVVEPPAIPTETSPSVQAAKTGERERLKRMKGRARTRIVSPGFLVPAKTQRRELKTELG